MLFLALSCLQGLPQLAAAAALAALGPDGLQLTQGNHPSLGFRDWLLQRPELQLRAHEGFSWSRVRTSPSETIALANGPLAQSVHPPRSDSGIALEEWLSQTSAKNQLSESMYPGYLLGSGEELEQAMRAGAELAVDVSHLNIQRESGVLSPSTAARLFDYDRIGEIHVSANDGRTDQHRPLTETSYGLAWARARLRMGCAVIIESYFHRLSESERRQQLALLREGA